MQAKPNHPLNCLTAVLTLLILFCSRHAEAAESLISDGREWIIDTRSMTVSCLIGETTTSVLRVFDIDADAASLDKQREGLRFSAQPVSIGGLKLTITSDKPTTLKLSLPWLASQNPKVIWPRGNGLLFAADDPFWQKEIFEQEWDAGESFSIPAWGSIANGRTISMFTTTPHRASLSFEKDRQSTDAYVLNLRQDFSAMAPSLETTLYLYVDEGENSLAPAKHYRHWLMLSGKLKTLDDKTKETTSAELLRGAAHVYLWGDDAISIEDIARDKWSGFFKTLHKQGNSPGSVAHYLKAYFTDEEWQAVAEGAATDWPYDYVKKQVATALSRAVISPAFATGFDWRNAVAAAPSDQLTSAQLFAQNARLLSSAFPDTFIPVEKWGDGASVKLFDALQAAGLDRLKLCTPEHATLVYRPWLAREAARRGWLLGTYDSYHSVHSPDAPADKTWSTAQMTAELYEKGAMRKQNGEFHKGFQGVGRKLNSVAGRSFMEGRVRNNLTEVPYNYYFMDCDATGEFLDDYNPLHPLGKEPDAAERQRRLTWISRQFDAVIGSEGGNAEFAHSIHVGEGVFAPYFGWDDADMKDPKSPYYRGRYFPPSVPDIFFKPTPLKERFQKLVFDPVTRIPLYQAALHDSVVVTAHWNNGHFKWSDAQTTQALTEILYLAPPQYHLTLSEWAKRKNAIVSHYKVWSPLHKVYGFAPLTDFRVLDDNGLVQETTFGDECRIIANFGPDAASADGQDIPPASVLVIAPGVWKEPVVYRPSP